MTPDRQFKAKTNEPVFSWSISQAGCANQAVEDAFIHPGTGVDPVTLTAAYVERRSKGENGKTAVDAYTRDTRASLSSLRRLGGTVGSVAA